MSYSYSVEYYLGKGYNLHDAQNAVEENKRKTSEGIRLDKAKKRLLKINLEQYITPQELLDIEKRFYDYLSGSQLHIILQKLVKEKNMSVDDSCKHLLQCCKIASVRHKRLVRSKDFIILLYGINSKEYSDFVSECKEKYATCNFEKFSESYDDKEQARIDFNIKYGSLNIENIMNKQGCTEDEALAIKKERSAKSIETFNKRPLSERNEINKKKAITLENMITKYGPTLGKIKYDEIIAIRKKTGTKEYYIEKYGIEEGNKRFFDEKVSNTHWRIEYWLKKGYSTDEALSMLNKIFTERPSFSKEYCISKYGYKRGIKIWEERQKLWQESLYKDKSDEEIKIMHNSRATTLDNYIKKYGEKLGVDKYEEMIDNRKANNAVYSSKQATRFFVMLYKKLRKVGIIDSKEPYFAISGSKERFIMDKENKKIFFYDFCIEKLKIIVEYHGIVFHPREDREWKQLFEGMAKTKEEAYANDTHKEIIAKNKGYDYLVVWSDSNIQYELERLVNYILEKKEQIENA
jgi:hypothetical protein